MLGFLSWLRRSLLFLFFTCSLLNFLSRFLFLYILHLNLFPSRIRFLEMNDLLSSMWIVNFTKYYSLNKLLLLIKLKIVLCHILFLFKLGCYFLIISSLLLIHLFLCKYHIDLVTVQRKDTHKCLEKQVKYKGSQIWVITNSELEGTG